MLKWTSVARLIPFVLALCANQAWADRYQIVDLGSRIDPVSINKASVVAADAFGPHARGLILRGEEWRKLPPHSTVAEINRTGNVAGTNYRFCYPVFWPHNSEPVNIELPGNSSRGNAYGINDDNIVVGSFDLSAPGLRCFMWNSTDGSLDIGGDDWYVCVARDINNAKQITGRVAPTDSSGERAFRWEAGEFTDLGVLRGSSASEGLAINDKGVVVGAAYTAFGSKAFKWNGELIDLDPENRYFSSKPLSINNSGQIVGWAKRTSRAETIAVRFAGSRPVHLSSEVTNIGTWKLGTANSINDKGIIVGLGHLDGTPHAFMLIPE